jgi:hypothetical protein
MFSRVASATSVAARCIAGSPPRRPGNFLLRGQKKVTKEEALNRTPAPHARAAPCDGRLADAHKRTAALSRLTCHEQHPSHQQPVRRAAARRAHQNSPMQRRSGDAIAASTSVPSPQRRGIADEPGVQPALTGVKGRFLTLVIGTAARAQRVASARNAAGCFRAPLMAAPRSCAVQRLFFGDFLLAPQKKVTPPPGGTPGTLPPSKRRLDKRSRRQS